MKMRKLKRMCARVGKAEAKHDPGLMAAIREANYQWQVKKQVIKEMTVNKEIGKLTTKYRYDVEDEFTDWMYGAFALALHRQCKFGPKRISAVFDVLQDIKNSMIDSGFDSDAIWELVRDEIGLDIKTDEVPE